MISLFFVGLPSYDRPDQVSRRTCYSPSANIQGGVSEAKVYNKDDGMYHK